MTQKVLFFIILIVLLVPFTLRRISKIPRAKEAACELRGAWVQKAFLAPQASVGYLDKLGRAGLNTLFVEISTSEEKERRELELFLEEAGKRGMVLHGWVKIFYPHKRSVPANLSNPAEKHKQSRRLLKILEDYPLLEGIHLDYIRFPAPAPSSWTAQRQRQISEVVEFLGRELKKTYPKKILSAAVWTKRWPDAGFSKSNTPYYEALGQDPFRWLERQWLDAVVVMNYTLDHRAWLDEMEHWRKYPEHARKIFWGMGWLAEKGRPEWGYDPLGVKDKILSQRKGGARGFVLFQLRPFLKLVPYLGDYDQVLIEALTGNQGAIKQKLSSCFSRENY